MGVFTKAPPPVVNRKRTLRSVPQLRAGAKLEAVDAGKTMLCVQVPRGITFFDRFRPPISEKRHELDELGVFVVKQMDGKRSVEAISEKLAQAYRLNQREAELSTVAFVKLLADRGVVVAVAGQEGDMESANNEEQA